MKPSGQGLRSAEAARARLLGDRAIRPVNDRRARLNVLAERLDHAGRNVITLHLADRVRTDRRLAPLLGQLFRMALHG